MHAPLQSISPGLHLAVNHAFYGKIFAFEGSNCLPVNRLYFCLDSCGSIEVSGHRLSLSAGTITFMPTNVDLTYRFTGGRMVALHFNLELFPGLDLFASEVNCRQLRSERSVCETLYEHARATPSLSGLLALQASIIAEASRFCHRSLEDLQRLVRLRERFSRLLNLIDQRLDAQLTIADLAAELGLSRDGLSRAFRRELGMTLNDYLARCLLSRASERLLSGHNVKETARQLGFGSEFYFSRFFKRQTGMPPSTYRRQALLEGLRKK